MSAKQTALFEGGNSRLHFAWWDGVSPVDPVDVPYPERGTPIDALIGDLLGGEAPAFAAVSSVSPIWSEPLISAIGTLFGERSFVIRSAADAGIEVRYDRPGDFGVDRALAALAAWREVRGPCVVVDAGTAVTVDAVDGRGSVAGGFIFPGADTLSHGLAARTGLPFIAAADSPAGPGTSTASCIADGIAGGLAGAVRALVENASESLGGADRILVTGGGGGYLSRILGMPSSFRPHLALAGLGLVSNDRSKRA